MNNLHPSLQFTMEEENNNMLRLLDVLVKKTPTLFITSIYRKDTFTGLYVSWDSFAPNQNPYPPCTNHIVKMLIRY